VTQLSGKAPKFGLNAIPALRPLKSLVKTALENDVPTGVRSGQRYVATNIEELPRGVEAAKRKKAVPLLVLPGPTPEKARRVPASLVLFPLEIAAGGGTSSLRELADAMVNVIAATWKQETEQVDAWRSLGLSNRAAAEPVPLSSGTQAFEGLLSGNQGGNLPAGGLWQLVKEAAAEREVALDQVLEGLLSRFTVWFSPYTGKPVSPSEALGIFHTVQLHWQANGCASHCYGAQYWNHPSIRATFTGKGGNVSFHETQKDAIDAALESNGRILSWAGRTDQDFEAACAEKNIPLLRIEDGFLRSVGLGAGLARGAMLAVDDLGIYYDPSRPSRLEALLKDYDLSETELERGRDLIERIKVARVSKYNFGKSKSFAFPEDKIKILIPGQVADDAAIRKSRSATIDCANTANVNLDLLKLARERHPEAYLIFKPHPDVETGLRKGRVERSEALSYADDIAEDANIIDLIEAVDGVETFSSLSGFEALLRGKKVTVHGAPFYAGWGLCEDLTEIPGRGRQRILPELVYLALVNYARTIDPVSLLPCTPEFLITRLSEQRKDRTHLLVTTLKRYSSWLGRKLGI